MATIKELAEQAGLVRFKFGEQGGYTTIEAVPDLNSLERFAELIRADQREIDAKLCEELGEIEYATAGRCAAAIRQRGEQP